MFKVGQDVVCIDAKHSNHLVNGEIYKVVEVCYGGTHLIVNRDGYTGEESTYSVSRFEIAAGHRIETNTGVTVITPSGTSKVKGGITAFVDMGDDSHIENHVSPNCKVGVK